MLLYCPSVQSVPTKYKYINFSGIKTKKKVFAVDVYFVIFDITMVGRRVIFKKTVKK